MQDLQPDLKPVDSTETQAFIAKLDTQNRLLPFKVILKEGCKAIMLRNVSIGEGWCNGTEAIVEKLSKELDQIVIAKSNWRQHKLVVTRRREEIKWATRASLKYYREQMPLDIGYGCTIHRGQGGCFSPTVVDAQNVFGSGMGYTACSRAPTLDQLYFLSLPADKHQFFVFEEIIQLIAWFDKFDVANGFDENEDRDPLPKIPYNNIRVYGGMDRAELSSR